MSFMFRQLPVPTKPAPLPGLKTSSYQKLDEILSKPDNIFALVAGRAVAPSKTSLSMAEIRKLGDDVGREHHLRGAFRQIGSQVVIGLRCPDTQTARILERGMALAMYRWDGDFGSGVTFTCQSPHGPIARAWIAHSHALLAALLKADKVVVVPFYRGQPVSIITSDPYIRDIRAALDRIMEPSDRDPAYPVVVEDVGLSFWESFKLSNYWDRLLTRQDRLQRGWAIRFMQLLYFLFKARVPEFLPPPSIDPDTADAAERMAAYPLLTDALWQRAGIDLLKLLHGRASPLKLIRKLDFTDVIDVIRVSDTEQTPFEPQRSYLGQFVEAFALREDASAEGLQAVFFQNTPDGMKLKSVPIPLESLTDEQAETYWKDVPGGYAVDAAQLIAGGLVPASLSQIKDEIRAIRLGCTMADARGAIQTLTDEANVLNRWTIPWGARVQVRIGPFVEIDFYPVDNEISILLRTEDGGYRWGAFNLRKNAWNLIHVLRNDLQSIFSENERSLLDEVELAIQLLLVTIVRDFVVLEDRTAGFAVVRAGRAVSSRPLDVNAPQIIYIPRVRYIHDPNVERMNQDLEIQERVPHQVRAHVRRSDNASPFQEILASRYGFTLAPGYTFVRPHYRGGLPPEREVIYRSRSAMRSLYGNTSDIIGTATSKWFQFELDVAAVMARMGFKVDHVAASRTGDEGVDVFAENCKTGEAWAIQCKCYAPERKIGPAVVRELIGALATYPSGTKGMITTTSSFSSGAVSLAREFNIVLNGLTTNPVTKEIELHSF